MRRVMACCVAFAALAGCGAERSAPAVPSMGAPVATAQTSTQNATARLNALRAAAGARPLRRSAVLDAVALAHAQDMAQAGYFSHTGRDGSTIGTRATRAGYRWCTLAENISQGQGGLAEAIEGWQTSAAHNRNMLNPKVTEFGGASVGGRQVLVLGAPGC